MSWQNKKAGDVRSRVNIYRQMLSAVVTTQTKKNTIIILNWLQVDPITSETKNMIDYLFNTFIKCLWRTCCKSGKKYLNKQMHFEFKVNKCYSYLHCGKQLFFQLNKGTQQINIWIDFKRGVKRHFICLDDKKEECLTT